MPCIHKLINLTTVDTVIKLNYKTNCNCHVHHLHVNGLKFEYSHSYNTLTVQRESSASQLELQALSSPHPFSPAQCCLPVTGWCHALSIKHNACLVSVPYAKKCWSTPPSPPSSHAEKVCCSSLSLVIRRPVLQSAGMHVQILEDLCCKVQALVKSVQGCNLLLQVFGTEHMPVAKLAMVQCVGQAQSCVGLVCSCVYSMCNMRQSK